MGWFSISSTPSEYSDEEVLARSIMRPWEFDELVRRYETAFLRKATSIIHNNRDAEEVVQDTFTKIYINASRFVPQEGASFRSWAYRILCNTAYTYYQRQRRESSRILNIDPEFEALLSEGGGQYEVHELHDMVERLLAFLPEHLATVLRLHYIERWPQQDIADSLGESVGAIKVRIHRAKQTLRLVAKRWGNLR